MKISIYKELIIVFLILFLIFSLTDCANIQSPPGGPKDSIPPSVIMASPLDMTKNFKDKKIVIGFSEWPDRNKVIQNISISPPVELGFKWSGTKLNIEFTKELKENTTYSFLLGTEYTDLKGNKPDSAFAITFSTGDRIDSGKIDGILVGENVAGAFIYCYKTDDKNTDTLNPETTPTEFKTQVGNNGSFTLRALPDGKYRLMAVKTEFKDNLFHSNSDFFGTTYQDFTVKDGIAPPAKIQLTKYPNLLPLEITSYNQASNKLLYFTLNKPLVNTLPHDSVKDLLQIFDSVSNTTIPIEAIFIDSTISPKLFIKLSDTLISQREYTLKILSETYFQDTSGINMKKQNYKFIAADTKNTFDFKLTSPPLKDSVRAIAQDYNYLFTFNFPIAFDSTKNYFKFIRLSDKVELPFSFNLFSPNTLKFSPESELSPEAWYRIEFKTKEIASLLGDKLKDTVYKYDFVTQDWRTFPKVSGKLLDQTGCGNIILQLVPSEKGNPYITKMKNDKTFTFKYVRPGKYTIRAYCDENNNGKYDYGTAYPYSHSEFFKSFSNEIKVQERWDVENIMLLLDK